MRYAERHLDPRAALAYRDKFRRGALRRLGQRREAALVRAALAEALRRVPATVLAPAILDCPCGAGRFAPLLAGALRAGGSYTGADHSPHMLELCRKALGERVGARFVEADARAVPLPDAAFDLAFCIRLLHHVPEAEDRAAILGELRRLCSGPVVLSWLDAEAPKQWFHARRLELAGARTRRTLLSRAELAREAAAQGLVLRRHWSLSGLFSGQCLALLVPTR